MIDALITAAQVYLAMSVTLVAVALEVDRRDRKNDSPPPLTLPRAVARRRRA